MPIGEILRKWHHYIIHVMFITQVVFLPILTLEIDIFAIPHVYDSYRKAHCTKWPDVVDNFKKILSLNWQKHAFHFASLNFFYACVCVVCSQIRFTLWPVVYVFATEHNTYTNNNNNKCNSFFWISFHLSIQFRFCSAFVLRFITLSDNPAHIYSKYWRMVAFLYMSLCRFVVVVAIVIIKSSIIIIHTSERKTNGLKTQRWSKKQKNKRKKQKNE